MRIVSLLPSATEMVCQLGLQDQLVGVSADSDWPPEVVKRLPVLNTVSIDTRRLSSREIDRAASLGHRRASLYHVDSDLLRQLRPDLILTQEVCEVCAVSRRDVDVAQSSQRRAGAGRPRADCPNGRRRGPEPRHGSRDELGTSGGPSRRMTWQEVVDYAPEVIVLVPCSLALERVAAEFGELRTLPAWNRIPAVRSGRVYAGHTHLFSRSGPRLVDGVEVLGRILHPHVFDAGLPAGRALKVAQDGNRLEPYR